MHLDTIRPILSQSPWFKSLPQDIIEQLVTAAKLKRLETGQLVYQKHDLGDGLYCVMSGKVRLSNVTLEGKELILTWMQPGNWFGEISLFDGLPRAHDAHAETPCELLKISSHDFKALLVEHPTLYPHFMRLLCQRIRTTFSFIDETGSLSLKGKLCGRILLLAEGLEHQALIENGTTLRISQESLALMLHSSRQTVNKLLQELQAQEVIQIHYGQVTIIDYMKLKTLCQI
ncbi:Crp/Fnr family transcriptional regulator [Paraglaciecola chathamensis]|uniref:Crp/Fnr family transcriptional regulator n=1 Tax=Paraglaciecola chathamensis TaxID=368405 RepID=UPI0027062EFE|nr:Crp/Fnr family transcriptional regulator [Paraglaciecola chathamensis]MDO6837886.1 Crp/Fnr family transcriptional regulator [Paraglaciecola chathamensis]